MLRSLQLAAVASLAFGAFVLAAGSPQAQTTGPTQTQDFSCTGAAVNWVVPANVNSVQVEAWGASGGIGDDGSISRPSSPAGLGGYTKATIATTPGETLQINVGCKGTDSVGAPPLGGFGGSPGGNGGIGGDAASGGGGGGSSDVRQGGTGTANRAVVAGGGGGSGGNNGVTVPVGVGAQATNDGHGGDGGDTSGVAGEGAGDPSYPVTGGGAGTQAANGAGGANVTCESTFKAGQPGTEAAGGAGGTQPTFGAGGGGGGGYKGGGGGAGCVAGSGGGGGSGFALASATGVAQTVGVQTGNGRVLLTYATTILQPAFTG